MLNCNYLSLYSNEYEGLDFNFEINLYVGKPKSFCNPALTERVLKLKLFKERIKQIEIYSNIIK